MGYWGTGNFEGDEPLEFLENLVAGWSAVIERCLAGDLKGAQTYIGKGATELIGYKIDLINAVVLPLIEVLIAVGERVPAEVLPELETIEGWAQTATRIIDEDGLEAWDASFEERKQTVVATFDRLLDLVGLAGPDPGEL